MADQTPSPEELRVKLLNALNTAIERRELKGTAIVQGLNAIVKLAEMEARTDPEPEDEGHVDLLESLKALPPEHAAGVLDGEIARMELVVSEYRELAAGLRKQIAKENRDRDVDPLPLMPAVLQ